MTSALNWLFLPLKLFKFVSHFRREPKISRYNSSVTKYASLILTKQNALLDGTAKCLVF